MDEEMVPWFDAWFLSQDRPMTTLEAAQKFIHDNDLNLDADDLVEAYND